MTDAKKGEGAGLRIHGIQTGRPNKLVGDTTWQQLTYDFTITDARREVDLVCELRALKGEVWFDTESLHLVRLK